MPKRPRFLNNNDTVHTCGFDVAGNLTNLNGTTRTYNAANQMTNDSTNTITFDDNGNMTSDGVNNYTSLTASLPGRYYHTS